MRNSVVNSVVCCLLSVVCCLLSVSAGRAQTVQFVPHVNGVANEDEFLFGDQLKSRLTAEDVTNNFAVPLYLMGEIVIKTAPQGTPPTSTVVAYTASSTRVMPDQTITLHHWYATYTVPGQAPPATNFYPASGTLYWSTTPNMEPDRSNIVQSIGQGNHTYHVAGQSPPGGQ